MKEKKTIALEDRGMDGKRLFSPSASRNLSPIIQAFTENKLGYGRVIEIGAGTGQHAAHLVSEFSAIGHWLAGEPDLASRESCIAWAQHLNVNSRINIVELDAASDWPSDIQPVDLVYSANVIHISPVTVLEGILKGAGRSVKPAGKLVFYGPFSRKGQHTSEGNRTFDGSLKARNTDWGVRDLELDVKLRAEACGFTISTVNDMPANNLFVVFERA